MLRRWGERYFKASLSPMTQRHFHTFKKWFAETLGREFNPWSSDDRRIMRRATNLFERLAIQ